MAMGFLDRMLCVLFCIIISAPIFVFSDGRHRLDDRFSKSRKYYEQFHKAEIYTKAAMVYSQCQVLRAQPSEHKFDNVFNDLQFNRKDKLIKMVKSIESMSIDARKNGESSSKCTEDILNILVSLVSGDSWPIQFLDASGKPGPSITKGWLNFIGNYDQCLQASAPTSNQSLGFQGKYCDLPLIFTGIPIPYPPRIGLCVPDSCSENDISPVFQNLLTAMNVTAISFAKLNCHTGKTEMSPWTIFAIIILCVVGTLVILGTLYDCIYLKRKNPYDLTTGDGKGASSPSSSSEPDNIEPDEKSSLLPNLDIVNSSDYYVLIKFLMCFSLYTNGKKLLNATSPPGSFDSIHGIRFISMSWIVLGHCFVVGGLGFSINFTTGIQKFLGHFTFSAIANALVSVDTFFTMSGLLTSYIYIKHLYRMRGPGEMNWAMYYFHRTWRLSPPFIIAMVIYVGLQQYMGSGSLWSDIQPNDKVECEKHWWTNVLYIQNIVHATPASCFPHTWYLANEMQFFLISPLMIIPFYYHWLAGLTSCSIILLISWVVTGVLSTQHDWSSTIVGIATSDAFTGYYIKPWCRIGPYIIGILAGYILVVTHGKPFKLKRRYVAIGWFVATVTALAIVYGNYGELSEAYVPSTAIRALYNTVSRSAWGVCVSWVILACTWGYGGPVNSFLSWSPFVVLGRLTYATYLIHFNLLWIFFANMELMFYLNTTTISIIFLGMLSFCNATAFVYSLLFESPFLALEKAFLRKSGKH